MSIKIGTLHTAIYLFNFTAGLIFTIVFALEIFTKFEGICPLYLKIDAKDSGINEDSLPVCNVFLAFHAIFQTVWPLLLGWLYAVAAGLCSAWCNNACCCPDTPETAARHHEEPAISDAEDSLKATPEPAVTRPRSGVCQHCCLRVLLLDFRTSRMQSFRNAEKRAFCLIAGVQIAITAYFALFLISLFMGYAARCSIAKANDQVRLYHGDRYGTLRGSDADIMNLLPYKTLSRQELCFQNYYTIFVGVSVCCSFMCNVLNLFLYIWRWLKGTSL
ncbi:hypothetical protein BOX15_Mlig026294g1 [Macrostomum lignano]|uniref:Uncharacterized protein n=1 Tax=Macrostomum lignano TaxID=282301 RepID=A0A267E7D7_9PLAT|nr:hypothetical protein BOX15_Mlig026294g1 [Macrostomum lignano]